MWVRLVSMDCVALGARRGHGMEFDCNLRRILRRIPRHFHPLRQLLLVALHVGTRPGGAACADLWRLSFSADRQSDCSGIPANFCRALQGFGCRGRLGAARAGNRSVHQQPFPRPKKPLWPAAASALDRGAVLGLRRKPRRTRVPQAARPADRRAPTAAPCRATARWPLEHRRPPAAAQVRRRYAGDAD